jgi:hypothetical protein
VERCGLDSCGSCEHGNEPLASIKGGEFLDNLSDCWLLKKVCALCGSLAINCTSYVFTFLHVRLNLRHQFKVWLHTNRALNLWSVIYLRGLHYPVLRFNTVAIQLRLLNVRWAREQY